MAGKKVIAVVGRDQCPGRRPGARDPERPQRRIHRSRPHPRPQLRAVQSARSARRRGRAGRHRRRGKCREGVRRRVWRVLRDVLLGALLADVELTQAGNMARAAKTAGVQHVIWSSLDDTRKLVPLSDDRMPTLMGEYKVPHYDAKGEDDHLFTDAGVPTTFLPTSFHWDSLIYFGIGPQRGEGGKLAITLPVGDKKLPGIAVADSGNRAYGSLERGGEYIGKTVGIAGEHLTGAQLAAGLTAAFGFPGAEDLGNMFHYKRDFEPAYCGARNLDVSRSLEPEPKTFAPWLAENKDRIPMSKRPGASTPAWRD